MRYLTAHESHQQHETEDNPTLAELADYWPLKKNEMLPLFCVDITLRQMQVRLLEGGVCTQMSHCTQHVLLDRRICKH